VAHSAARVQCRRPRRNRGTQHAHFATRIAASLSPMCSLAVSCSLQPPFIRVLSLAHISIKVTVANRCDASCCIHRLASPESSPLAPSQLVAPHSPSVLSRRPLLADGHAQLVLFLRELPQQSSLIVDLPTGVALGLPYVRPRPTHGNHLRHSTPFAQCSRVHTLRYDPA
jgi:hypothetical protein